MGYGRYLNVLFTSFSGVVRESGAIFTVGARRSSDRCIPKYQNSTGVKFPIASRGRNTPDYPTVLVLSTSMQDLTPHLPMYWKIAQQNLLKYVFFYKKESSKNYISIKSKIPTCSEYAFEIGFYN